MLIKFLREVIVIVVGKQAEPIADLLYSSKHVNEFLISKKLGITINQTRNILYKIADQGLVTSIRKKDKRKGWYTYFWKLEILKTLEFLKDVLLKRAEQINNQIKSRESKQFYVCETCNIEYNEENALLHDFTCPECGNVFVLKDNAPVVRDLRKQLDKLDRDLSEIEEAIAEEKAKLEKQKEKEVKKIKKKDAEKRKVAKEARKSAKNINLVKKKSKSQLKSSKKPKRTFKKKLTKKSKKK